MKTIFIFGNQDLKIDNLPIKILPKLKKIFPKIKFIVSDPNEMLPETKNLWIIDTVINLKKVRLFTSLTSFEKSKGFSVHDYDLLADLKLAKKINRIKNINIIGIPNNLTQKTAFMQVEKLLKHQFLS